MGLLQELFRTHGPAYLDRFGPTMPKAHKKVIAAIADCHTEAAGSTLYVCEACGQRHVVHRSCGNRHCPCCQQGKGRAWLERHRARQLPGEHYLPVRALSRIVRAKFRDRIDSRGLLGEIPAEVWAMEWNVNCRAAGDGSGALQCLAPYVFKVAIGERRILAVDAHHVRFRYQKPHSHRVRTMTLPILEFMRRFLQHVLPRGFMKVRAPGGRQSPYRASGGPALPSLRGRPAVLPPAPARRLRDRLPRRAWPPGRRRGTPATSAHRERSAGSEAPRRPISDPVPQRSRTGTASVCPSSRAIDIVTLTLAPSRSAPSVNSLFDPSHRMPEGPSGSPPSS